MKNSNFVQKKKDKHSCYNTNITLIASGLIKTANNVNLHKFCLIFFFENYRRKMSVSTGQVLLYVPNLIGYARIVLLLLSLTTMLSDPYKTAGMYMLRWGPKKGSTVEFISPVFRSIIQKTSNKGLWMSESGIKFVLWPWIGNGQKGTFEKSLVWIKIHR